MAWRAAHTRHKGKPQGRPRWTAAHQAGKHRDGGETAPPSTHGDDFPALLGNRKRRSREPAARRAAEHHCEGKTLQAISPHKATAAMPRPPHYLVETGEMHGRSY